MPQTLFPKLIVERLARNGTATRAAQAAGKDEPHHIPVVKIFNPTGGATWLITESDPKNPDQLFGLCDLGMGEPELGYLSRTELEGTRVRMGLRLERDAWFKPSKRLSEYVNEARRERRIVA